MHREDGGEVVQVVEVADLDGPTLAKIFLGDIPVEDVAVEGYFGVMDSTGNIQGGETVPLEDAEPAGDPLLLWRAAEKLA